MNTSLRVAVLLLGMAVSTVTIADVDDIRGTKEQNSKEWRLQKNDARHKIKVYVKNEEGQKIRSFKV